MTESEFMARLWRALQGKSHADKRDVRLAVMRVYGIAAPLIKKHPDALASLSEQIDRRLPPGLPLAAYLPQIRAIVEDLRQSYRRAAAGDRGMREPVSVHSVIEAAKEARG